MTFAYYKTHEYCVNHAFRYMPSLPRKRLCSLTCRLVTTAFIALKYRYQCVTERGQNFAGCLVQHTPRYCPHCIITWTKNYPLNPLVKEFVPNFSGLQQIYHLHSCVCLLGVRRNRSIATNSNKGRRADASIITFICKWFWSFVLLIHISPPQHAL